MAVGSGKGGHCPAQLETEPGFSTSRNAALKCTGSLESLPAPGTPELSGELVSAGMLLCVSCGVCTGSFLTPVVECAQGAFSAFSELSGESALCTAMLADLSLKH